jgi:hypothetical protein
VIAIVALVLSAYLLPGPPQKSGRDAPSPWLCGLIVCALGSPWAAFVLLGFGSFPRVPFTAALAVGIAVAALAYLLVRRWTSRKDWSDRHRFAVVFGGILACMIGGFAVFQVGGALRIDWIGKAVLNAAAILWLLRVRSKVTGSVV